MSYLNRVARRAGASSAPLAGNKARVERAAVASGSPLADLDQRLHLDPFSESSNLAASAANTLDMAAQSKGSVADTDPAITLVNNPHQPLSGLPDSASKTVVQPRTNSVVNRHQSNRKGNSTLDLGAGSSPLHNEADRVQAKALDVSQATSAKPLTTDQLDSSAQFKTYSAQTSPNGLASHALSTNASAADAPAPSSSLQESLLLAQRWVEGGSTPGSTIDKSGLSASDTLDRPASSPLSNDPRSGGVNGRQKKSPLTRVEIGSIEVEVVAPAKPAVQPIRSTAAPSTRPASLRTTPFGWRQR